MWAELSDGNTNSTTMGALITGVVCIFVVVCAFAVHYAFEKQTVTFHLDIVIACPPEKAFNLLKDPRNALEIRPTT